MIDESLAVFESKKYLTDCASVEGFLRVIQLIWNSKEKQVIALLQLEIIFLHSAGKSI